MDELFLDCQTTGMHPNHGHLLEIAWSDGKVLDSFLVQLPEGEKIPKAVTLLTGITAEDMAQAIPREEVKGKFATFLFARPHIKRALVHYAQFEKPFLAELFGEFPLPIFCTHKIARRLHPESPSRSTRGILGYFGKESREIRRAAEHVRATQEIWECLAPDIETSLEELLDQKPEKKKPSFRFDRDKRLALPECPGIYRMLSKEGKVLYVGKATSLRDRVNSYFRGQKGKERRKLEMLAHVWDIETVECPSPLEAAILETDEIKRFDPPYNVMLKVRARSLVFYSRDFSRSFAVEQEAGLLGPFRADGSIEQMRAILRGEPVVGLFDRLEAQLLGITLAELREKRGPLPDIRACLALGLRLLREREKEEPVDDAEGELEDDAPEDLTERLESLFRHAAWDYRRAKKLTRLLNARIELRRGDAWQILRIANGNLRVDEAAHIPAWRGLGIADYDRMIVLNSELAKVEHRWVGDASLVSIIDV